jgi:hypothetical protein
MEALPAPRTFSYSIDDHDRIVACNDDWFAFARENEGAQLTRATTRNRPIWNFIDDPETRHLYRLIFSRVRSGKTIHVYMRCDSPTARRKVELRIAPLPDRGVSFESQITHEEPRDYVALLDVTRERAADILSICSWCKKVQVPGQGWFEVEEALARLELTDESHLPQLANIVCYDCYRQIVHLL